MLKSIPNPARTFFLLLVLVGLIFRCAPIFYSPETLYGMTSEDGYLMLTMSRNMALGNGMSISNGEIASNGTQPLATFLWTIGYLITGGSKYWGVFFMQIMSVGIGCLGATLVYRLFDRVLKEFQYPVQASLLLTAVWFASHRTVGSFHNGLETGLYACLVIWFLLDFSSLVNNKEKSCIWSSWIKMGLVGGIAAWARIDTALLLIAAGCYWLLVAIGDKERSFLTHLRQGCVMGFTAALVIAPWLSFNLLSFGHIMPISGHSQSLSAVFGSNFITACSALAIYYLAIIPVPASIRENPWMAFFGMSIILAQLSLVLNLIRQRTQSKGQTIIQVGLLYTLILFLFYALYFGAPHFLIRYYYPIYPIALLCTFLTFAHYLPTLSSKIWKPTTAAALVLITLLNLRVFLKQENNGHMQVVNWVKENTSEATWVGAIQTGTLGYFHDRTINLDGKVNPYALQAREDGAVLKYVVQTPIEVLADWHGIANWKNQEPIKSRFDVVENSKEPSLGVLIRKTPLSHSASLQYHPTLVE